MTRDLHYGRHRRGRRFVGRGVALSAVGIIILVAGILVTDRVVRPGAFPMRVLQLVGEFNHLKQSEIEAIVMPLATGNFFTLDVEDIDRAVEAQPWVSQAKVMRYWPDTLQVEVQEQRPVAKWQEKSWLSPQGEVLVLPHSGGLKVMPKLNGPDGMAPTVLSRFRQWNQLLNGVGLALNALSRTAVGTWNLNVSSFQIGAEQDRDFELTVSEVEADFRLGRFIRLYSQNNEEGWRQQIRRIDLRYPNGMAVALNQPLKPSTTE
ncbi:MAG: hypothetical protein CL388_07185 [Acidiferrobacteraceae bacterium]|nr:hypothetical protein [Acidiferrobacteraceae bacterium]MDP6435183.1 FtsQ-type POTRA domain-containing protein [Arenicellales bacterium]MDP6671541.1 FtsQ-type POTRA domain-containing protein [Arenicellales bacterium]MDP6724555.1 FtsQ-type POTRA domain-containing protein [Arenicellales bacterium]